MGKELFAIGGAKLKQHDLKSTHSAFECICLLSINSLWSERTRLLDLVNFNYLR